jgi:hypothetical protein
MTSVSVRPGIVIRVPVKFPASVTATSPLIVTRVGANYNFAIDGASVLIGDCFVWQLKMALASLGTIAAAASSIPTDPGNTVKILWENLPKTSSGDLLHGHLVTVLGAASANAAYALAPSLASS